MKLIAKIEINTTHKLPSTCYNICINPVQ